LFAAASGGTPIGNETLTNNSVTVTNGIFTVELSFTDPAAFDGSDRWLEIAVKKPADPGFTTLANRQKLTSTPYAIKTRFLSTAGNGNLFAGQGAGNANNGGANNAFVGSDAGRSNTLGGSNSFFGFSAGFNNDNGGNNTFLGTSAGFNSFGSTANGNTFVGASSGSGNTSGRGNTLIGFEANTPFPGTLINATALGSRAFVTQDNSLVLGSIAGVNNATANTNVGIGTTAPQQTLHVNGLEILSTGGSAGFKFRDRNSTSSADDWVWYSMANVARFWRPGTGDIIGVTTAGNVGVGTTGPSERLHVSGNGIFTGNLTVGGTLFATLPAGSGNYIQNTTSLQSSSNFNISGNGTAGGTLNGNIVNATTQFNIGGSRILSNAGTNNLFAGVNVGLGNVFGIENTYVGNSAGPNSDGSLNSFFGFKAGFANRDGNNNSFFGHLAGRDNLDSGANSFFGDGAGATNQSGNGNSFFGFVAGSGNTTGSDNAYFGNNAGFGINSGNGNSLIGALTGGIAGNSNATAIGYRAFAGNSNALVLGSIANINGCTPANNCNSVNVAIGTTNPAAKLHITGTGIIRTLINSDSNAGVALTVNNQPGWSVATVTGGQFQIFNDAIGQNAVWINSTTNNVGIGTNTPNDKLEVNGVLRVDALGSVGGTQLCRNLSNQISNCSSSLRYKTNVNPFSLGLNLIKRLSPITFNWKQGGMKDFGLGAEDVENVEPLLVTHNDKGEIEGVKYDRVAVVLINAVKEQQAQIESQQKLI
jgi:hypothetical protein